LDIFKVALANSAKKELKKLPFYIVRKLLAWVDNIENNGLNEVRKVPGYHDEPLKGSRTGQRSVRLSKSYRAIYIVDQKGKIEVLKVVEINKHDY
jgi:proteic killer suppression protein